MSTEAVRVAIGDVVVIPLLDGFLELDAREAAIDVSPRTFSDADPGMVDRHGRIRLPVICHLVHSRGGLIMVDSGIGARPRPGWPRGRLDGALAGIGVHPDDIALVINTHMHGDHVGWNTVATDVDGAEPYFPNARYLFQKLEWDHWIGGGHASAGGYPHLRECVLDLSAKARVELVGGDVAVTPDVSLVATPGHTPGHVAVGIASAGERALIVGDVTHYAAQLDHPDWSPAWDLDRTQAGRTRERVFRSLEDDPGATLLTSHWPYPGAGRIVSVAGRRLFTGVERPD